MNSNNTSQATVNSGKPVVTVCCLTFNHAPFIEKTLNGFLKQVTAFPVQFLVHDDASTDGTQKILLKYAAMYPGRLEFILQPKNIWSQNINAFETEFFPRCQSEYIALCEGDDYWTDPQKLQRQVEYFEAHPEVALVHTDFAIDCPPGHDYLPYYESMQRRRRSGKIFPELFLGNFISTPTVMVRTELYRKVSKKFADENIDYNFDLLYWLEFARDHEIHFIPITTAVYRIHTGGVSHDRTFMDRNFGKILTYHLINSFRPDHISELDKGAVRLLGNRILDVSKLIHQKRTDQWKAWRKARELIGSLETLKLFFERFRGKMQK
ncbi:MAG: glycosyltransferase [Fibrobacteres bacterium]|nr:glycosyltransferase [Fibrobacterota bacterium]